MTLAVQGSALPAPNEETLQRINRLQSAMLELPQIDIRTEHIIHGGMYTRTIRLAAGAVITGALVKVPTILVVNGRCAVFAGDQWIQMEGFQVIAASKGRKQIFVAWDDIEITMTFRTDAQTVEAAEEEFTDEHEMLMSRRFDGDIVTITGESCQER